MEVYTIMGLRLTFNLVLGIAVIIGIALASFFSYQYLQANARAEVLDSARIMMQSALAVRAYTVNEIRPLLELQQKRKFLSQTVPAYSAHRYVAQLQREYPEYSYREATLNPTNPADRATQWEADVVGWFRNHKDEKEIIGERITPTGQSLYMARPIQIKNKGCLECHSTPTAAPKTMIASYGTANGFGWKLNEIVGAQIVQVPMALPLKRAHDTFFVILGAIVAVFVVVVILLNLMLSWVVINPIKRMGVKANEVSMGALEAEELNVKGTKEMVTLGQSFNRMHRSLANAVKMLDDCDV
jgi:methyl-accepting chemotaxis protein